MATSALQALLQRRQMQLRQVQQLGEAGSAAQTPLSPMSPIPAKGNRLVSGLLGGGTTSLAGAASNFAGALQNPPIPNAAGMSFSPTEGFTAATGKSMLAPATSYRGSLAQTAQKALTNTPAGQVVTKGYQAGKAVLSKLAALLGL